MSEVSQQQQQLNRVKNKKNRNEQKFLNLEERGAAALSLNSSSRLVRSVLNRLKRDFASGKPISKVSFRFPRLFPTKKRFPSFCR